MRLVTGQKIPLSAVGISSKLSIEVDYGVDDVDIVLFGLDENKTIKDDRYTVLFSNHRSPEGAIQMHGGNLTTTFDVDLNQMPPTIKRLMVVASHDKLSLSSVRPLAVTVGSASYDAGSTLGAERAAMLIEIYLHNGEWRLASIGQGFADGLAKLIEHLGGSVDDSPSSSATNITQTVSSPAPAPVNLSKITLEKKKSVSLEKHGSDFGDIVLNLNWKQNIRKGIFGSKSLDLDLGCLFEMQDGSLGIVQALGNTFGDYQYMPYIELDGDDRSGSNANGETIRINGRHFDKIRRIAVFALIYEGVTSWAETDAQISIKAPGQPEIVVEIRDGERNQRLYAMAIIENDNGSMKITNHARCYGDQKKFADEIGIYLRWVAGSK